MWPVCSGNPIFGRVRCREAVPPVYIRESRPTSAIGKRTLPTHRKDPFVSYLVSPRPGWSLGRLLRTCVSVWGSPASDSPASDSSAGLHAGGS